MDAHVAAEVEVYPGAWHGWCIRDMPERDGKPVYSQPDAEHAHQSKLKLALSRGNPQEVGLEVPNRLAGPNRGAKTWAYCQSLKVRTGLSASLGIPAYSDSEMTQELDYYEVLQINRNADMETVHRVYRFMATRFHPDNAKTGDLERFLLLRQAYQVLSDPGRRQQYDAASAAADSDPLEIFELQDFIDGTRRGRTVAWVCFPFCTIAAGGTRAAPR